MKNFAITGCGRSGTKFLAGIMNRSKTWIVKHEPLGPKGRLRKTFGRFQKDHYGEVNSYLRFQFEYLDVENKGVIVRNPQNLLMSAFNWRGDYQGKVIPDIEKALLKVDEIAQEHFVIRFEDMTTDAEYLQGVLSHFGIMDVAVNDKDLSVRVNKSKRNKKWTDLKPEVRLAGSKLDWFADRYGYDVEW